MMHDAVHCLMPVVACASQVRTQQPQGDLSSLWSPRLVPVEHDVDVTQGRVFEINNVFEHFVSHTGEAERIHLLIDYTETPVDYYRLQEGQALNYQDLDPINYEALRARLARG
jgi:hypothetical protein